MHNKTDHHQWLQGGQLSVNTPSGPVVPNQAQLILIPDINNISGLNHEIDGETLTNILNDLANNTQYPEDAQKVVDFLEILYDVSLAHEFIALLKKPAKRHDLISLFCSLVENKLVEKCRLLIRVCSKPVLFDSDFNQRLLIDTLASFDIANKAIDKNNFNSLFQIIAWQILNKNDIGGLFELFQSLLLPENRNDSLKRQDIISVFYGVHDIM